MDFNGLDRGSWKMVEAKVMLGNMLGIHINLSCG